MDIKAFRKKYPMYDHMSDNILAEKLHKKYYAHTDYNTFATKFGVQTRSDENAMFDFLGETVKAIPRGFMSVGKGIVGTVEWAIPGEQAGLLEASRKIEEAQQREVFKYDPSSLAGKAGAIIGEAVPYMAAALASGGAAGAGAAALGAGATGTSVATGAGAALIGFSVEGQAAYDAAKAKGVSDKAANIDRVLVGSINAAIEGLQITQLLKSAGVGRKAVKSLVNNVKGKAWRAAGKDLGKVTGVIVRNAINEGLEEMAQEGVSIAVPYHMRGDIPRTAEGKVDWAEVGTRMGASFAGGALAGGVLGGGMQLSTLGGLAAPTKEDLISYSKKIAESESSDYTKVLQQEALNDMARRMGVDFYVKPPKKAFLAVAAANVIARDMAQFETQRSDSKEEIKKRRAFKFKNMESIYQDQNLDPETRAAMAAAEAQGYDRKRFPEMPSTINSNHMRKLMESYHASKDLSTADKKQLDSLFQDILSGVLPHPSRIKLFDKTFGTDWYKNYEYHNKSKLRRFLFDAVNMRKALMAAGDVSFGGRQGWLFMMSRPVQWSKSVYKGYKAFMSPEYAQVQELNIQTNPGYQLGKRLGLEFTEAGITSKAQEEFRSELAKKIPGIGKIIAASDRAFNVTGNSLRWNAFYRQMEQWEGTGKTDKEIKQFVDWLNAATGRGRLPHKIEQKYGDLLNAMFWAPKLYMGRIQTVTDLVPSVAEFQQARESKNYKSLMSPARKIMAKELLKASITLSMVIGMMKLLGAEIEDDPRSSDWGKGKWGNTRIDMMGGYQQMLRLVAQLWMGQRKSTATGIVTDVRAKDTMWRFLRGKLSPNAATLVDAITGTTYRGEKVRWTDPNFTFKYIYETSTFLFAQDLIDAISYEGIGMGAIVAPLAVHGIGAQTYETTPSNEAAQIKNKMARSYFGEGWDNIGPQAQKALRTTNPQIQVFEERARMERENYDFASRMLEEQKEMGRKVKKNLHNAIQRELDALYVDIGGFSRRIGGGWFLNKENHRKYAQNTKIMLNKVLAEIIHNPNYQKLPQQAKHDLLQGIVDDVKKKARQHLIKDANIKDLEKISSQSR